MRILLSILVISSFIFFNFAYGLYYLTVLIIIWLDILLLQIIIPVVSWVSITLFNTVRYIVSFILSLPKAIARLLNSIYLSLKHRSYKTYSKSRTLTLKLHFSISHFVCLLLLSFGFSILVNQSLLVLLFVLIIQLLIIIYPMGNLNKLFIDLDLKIREEELKRRHYYQLFFIYFVVLLYVFEAIFYVVSLFVPITIASFIVVGMFSIVIGFMILFFQPLTMLVMIFVSNIQRFFMYIIKSLTELYQLIVSDPLESIKVLVISIGMVVLSFQLSWERLLIFLNFFSIIFYKILVIDTTRNVNNSRMEQTDDDSYGHQLKLQLTVKYQIYVYLASFLTFSIASIIFLSTTQQSLVSPVALGLGLLLIIVPNILFIIKILKTITDKIFQFVYSLLSVIKINTYDKALFIYRTVRKYNIVTKFEILKAGLNIFVTSLSVFIITHSLFSNAIIIVPLWLSLAIILIIGLQVLSTNYTSILQENIEADQNFSTLSLFSKVKDILFDSREKAENQIIDSLKKQKSTTLLIFGLPYIVLAHITDLLTNPVLVTNLLLTILILVVILLIINVGFLTNVFMFMGVALIKVAQSIGNAIVYIVKALGQVLYGIINFFVVLTKKISYSTYFLLFKKGKTSITILFTLVVSVVFIVTHISAPALLYTNNTGILYIILFYIIGVAVIWYEFVGRQIKAFVDALTVLTVSVANGIYSIIAKNGKYSLSIDLFIIIIAGIVSTDFSLGYDFTRTEVFLVALLIGLIIIWSSNILILLAKLGSVLGMVIQKAINAVVRTINRISITLQYVAKELTNWFLFYVSILFSVIFVFFGFAFITSGILNDKGKFISSIFFDFNLLFGLANTTNIILLLLGIALIFAGLLLIRIINENKERLFLHVFKMPEKKGYNYEVVK